MTRRRKWMVAGGTLLAVVLMALLVARLMLSSKLRDEIVAAVSERYGVVATADDMSVSLTDGTASLHGIRVKDGATTVLEAERVDVKAGILDVLEGRVDLAKLVIVRPVLRLTVEADGRTNLARILATAPSTQPSPGPEEIVVLRAVRVEDGVVEYVDAIIDAKHPLRLVARGVDVSISQMQLGGEPVTKCAADLRIDCELEQEPEGPARVSIVAWHSPPGASPSLGVLHGAATGCDLAHIPQYIGRTQRAAIGGSILHLAAAIQSADGVIGPGAIVGEVDGTRTVLPMSVGGTTDEPVFQLDSSLGSLLKIPLDRFGTVGDVVVGSGKSAWRGASGAAVGVGKGVVGAGSSVGGGFVTAAGDVAAGDPLGALGAVGGGAVGGAKSVGAGLVAGVKSLFGIGTDTVANFSAEEAAAFDARVIELHAGRRAAMLQAALASVPEGADGGRRARIEDEIAAAAKPPK